MAIEVGPVNELQFNSRTLWNRWRHFNRAKMIDDHNDDGGWWTLVTGVRSVIVPCIQFLTVEPMATF
ncbi:hypothetical protein CEXT_471991 [Caerostris extrusa]|uniref:Uncharacterized protein n=1 Tax=Caerostris extrusa TaxID=172846 RepID=A0AAV4YAG9_CAEEX|nr:hypothetical protein CEXT_471991 [Caerostris extrusa]